MKIIYAALSLLLFFACGAPDVVLADNTQPASLAP
jgi:hypothetical protein